MILARKKLSRDDLNQKIKEAEGKLARLEREIAAATIDDDEQEAAKLRAQHKEVSESIHFHSDALELLASRESEAAEKQEAKAKANAQANAVEKSAELLAEAANIDKTLEQLNAQVVSLNNKRTAYSSALSRAGLVDNRIHVQLTPSMQWAIWDKAPDFGDLAAFRFTNQRTRRSLTESVKRLLVKVGV